MDEDKTTAEQEDEKPLSIEAEERPKLEFLDYVALTIALLQTTLLPFVLIGITILLLYASLEIAVYDGALWLIAIWVPFTTLLVLARRLLFWRRLRRIRSKLR